MLEVHKIKPSEFAWCDMSAITAHPAKYNVEILGTYKPLCAEHLDKFLHELADDIANILSKGVK